MTQFFRNIPTPLEVVDAGLDSVAEVVQLPARVGMEVTRAANNAAGDFKQAVDKPKNQGEIPASPDTIVSGAVDAVAAIGGGVVESVTGVFKAVQETGEGVKSQIDSIVRR